MVKSGKSRSKKLLTNSRQMIRKLIDIYTGHNLLRKHAKRLNLTNTDKCRYCKGLDSVETILLLWECVALSRTRFMYLGNIASQGEIYGLSVKDRIGCCPLSIG